MKTTGPLVRTGAREVEIERVVPGGDGLARVDGIVTLVPGALPGDRVRIELREDGPRLNRGAVLEVLSAGASRREESAVCPLALDGSCGGCDWPAARPEAHRELKTALLLDALRRLGGLDADHLPPVDWHGSAGNYRLRNRLHVDGLSRVGFFAPMSHDVADLTTCQIVSESLLARLPAVREAIRGVGVPSADLQTLEGRLGSPLLGELRLASGGEKAARLSDALFGPLDGVRVLGEDGSLLASAGPSSLDLSAGGAAFRVSVSSFFQGNRYLLDTFLEETRSALSTSCGDRPLRRTLDLYAGVGFLTRPLVERGGEVSAVEIDRSSAADLAVNTSRWKEEGLADVTAVTSTAEDFLRGAKGRFDAILADPPREGLSNEVRRHLLRLAPSGLVLVSCDPATLARDLKTLKEGFSIERLALLDLFPGTHHVETIVALRRR